MPNPNAFDGIIFQASKKYGIQAPLIKAIVRAESNFDPRAYRYEAHINDASRGLMQVLAGTARWMKYSGPIGDDATKTGGLYDPETNIEVGTRFLAHLRNALGGDLERMIAGYNAGPGNARRGPNGFFPNQGYVDRVLRFFREYNRGTAAEAFSLVLLQPHAPQLGPTPSSPNRIVETPSGITTSSAASVPSNPLDTITSAFESVVGPDVAPWALAGAGALALALLFGRRR